LFLYSPTAGLYLPQTPLRELFRSPDPHLRPEPIRDQISPELTCDIIRIRWQEDQNKKRNSGYNTDMADSKDVLEQQFLEMRWRTLSLAADLDRIGRGDGGARTLKDDARLQKLRRALEVLMSEGVDRAERVQMIFSDMTPPPK
jgi:hypothetical protein